MRKRGLTRGRGPRRREPAKEVFVVRAIGKVEIAVAGACFLAGCSVAVYRIAHIDPVIEHFFGKTKCVLPSDPDYSNQFNLSPHCAPSSIQEITDWRTHPIAYVVGTILPTVLLTPAGYWLSGFYVRRKLKPKTDLRHVNFAPSASKQKPRSAAIACETSITCRCRIAGRALLPRIGAARAAPAPALASGNTARGLRLGRM